MHHKHAEFNFYIIKNTVIQVVKIVQQIQCLPIHSTTYGPLSSPGIIPQHKVKDKFKYNEMWPNSPPSPKIPKIIYKIIQAFLKNSTPYSNIKHAHICRYFKIKISSFQQFIINWFTVILTLIFYSFHVQQHSAVEYCAGRARHKKCLDQGSLLAEGCFHIFGMPGFHHH